MKVIHERAKCIGCGSCVAVCPRFWEMGEDGRAKLLNSESDPKTDTENLEIKKKECNQEAAEVCPVQCIHIVI